MIEEAQVPDELKAPRSDHHWLVELTRTVELTPKSRAVLQVLDTQPRMSSYSAAAKVAEAAGGNVATVIRTAQTLGFPGWPPLQAEIRARYLASLSVPEVAAEHATDATSVFTTSLHRDLDSIAQATRHVDTATAMAVVERIATSRRTLVIAQGSFEAAGKALAHNATLAGYRVELAGGANPADMLNILATMGPDDTLIAISLWRLYQRTVRAAQVAKEFGSTVCVITDSTRTALTEAADHTLVVSAEGAAFFPSVAAALSVAQALSAQLAAYDPERTRRSIERSEALWERFDVLQVPRRITRNDETKPSD